MPRIQCLLGPQSDIYVGGVAYNFTTDEHGRAVANVPSQLHAQCFLSTQHYRLLPDDMILGDAVQTDKIVNDDDMEVVSQIVEPGASNQQSTEDTSNGGANDDENAASEQPKEPEGEGTAEVPQPDPADAPQPEKKKAGRPKKADAATKVNAE
ncbi:MULTISPECIES: hypothetical protein [unclassified Brucella]|uniref:hypothetical protein n=1 Tax=unclassified Brucella TaxID=2632610 RepID=UPI0012AD9994|nr:MULTISPECIES: hypothetical protein [unclassified Brucella]MRN43462.1 hypothetical protein [Brucella sp. 09RB8913]MRN59437.1 hypothetical protein [Brucella sp. 09RB8918]MRN67968.1 hypothetical protein [Brucella sp. 10RB9213]